MNVNLFVPLLVSVYFIVTMCFIFLHTALSNLSFIAIYVIFITSHVHYYYVFFLMRTRTLERYIYIILLLIESGSVEAYCS